MIDERTIERIAILRSSDRSLCKIYGHNWMLGPQRPGVRPMPLSTEPQNTTVGVVETKHWCRRCNIEVWK